MDFYFYFYFYFILCFVSFCFVKTRFAIWFGFRHHIENMTINLLSPDTIFILAKSKLHMYLDLRLRTLGIRRFIYSARSPC
jgi:hypothetical protein